MSTTPKNVPAIPTEQSIKSEQSPKIVQSKISEQNKKVEP
jgi:hypothetical protein